MIIIIPYSKKQTIIFPFWNSHANRIINKYRNDYILSHVNYNILRHIFPATVLPLRLLGESVFLMVTATFSQTASVYPAEIIFNSIYISTDFT